MQERWNAVRRWWNGGGAADDVRELASGQAIRLPSFREGSSLRLESGLVVVTREGDRRDHILEAGAELQLPRPGLVVAWAVEASRIVVRRRKVPLADWRTAAVTRAADPAASGAAARTRAPDREAQLQHRSARAAPHPGHSPRPAERDGADR